jgi:hypothetical protein
MLACALCAALPRRAELTELPFIATTLVAAMAAKMPSIARATSISTRL